MGKNCIVAGCSNTHKNGVSLFKFPADKDVRLKWIKEVRKTRANWKQPSSYSCVCSDHFTIDCFEEFSSFSEKVGMKIKKMLKPNAIPTLFPRPSSHIVAKKRAPSGAYEKRERGRVNLPNTT